MASKRPHRPRNVAPNRYDHLATIDRQGDAFHFAWKIGLKPMVLIAVHVSVHAHADSQDDQATSEYVDTCHRLLKEVGKRTLLLLPPLVRSVTAKG